MAIDILPNWLYKGLKEVTGITSGSPNTANECSMPKQREESFVTYPSPASALLKSGRTGQTIAVPPDLGISLLGNPEAIKEGEWYATALQEDVFASVVRPGSIDRSELVLPEITFDRMQKAVADSQVYLLAFDLERFTISYKIGESRPMYGELPTDSSSTRKNFVDLSPLGLESLPTPNEVERLVAAFPGGFRDDNEDVTPSVDNSGFSSIQRFGFWQNGVQFSPLLNSAATLIQKRNGEVYFGPYFPGIVSDSEIIDAKQSGFLLVTKPKHQGQGTQSTSIPADLGNSTYLDRATYRSFVGTAEKDGRRFMVIGWGPYLDIFGAQTVLQGLNASSGMYLDQNMVQLTSTFLYSSTQVEPLSREMALGDEAPIVKSAIERDMFLVLRKRQYGSR